MKQEDCDWRTKERRRLKEIKKKKKKSKRLEIKTSKSFIKILKLKENEDFFFFLKKTNFTRMRRNFSSDSTDKNQGERTNKRLDTFNYLSQTARKV